MDVDELMNAFDASPGPISGEVAFRQVGINRVNSQLRALTDEKNSTIKNVTDDTAQAALVSPRLSSPINSHAASSFDLEEREPECTLDYFIYKALIEQRSLLDHLRKSTSSREFMAAVEDISLQLHKFHQKLQEYESHHHFQLDILRSKTKEVQVELDGFIIRAENEGADVEKKEAIQKHLSQWHDFHRVLVSPKPEGSFSEAQHEPQHMDQDVAQDDDILCVYTQDACE